MRSEDLGGAPIGSAQMWRDWRFQRALLVLLLTGTVINAIRPTVSYRALALGAGSLELGAIAASFALLALFLAIPVGRLIDLKSELSLLLAGVALIFVVCLALTTANSISALVATQAVLGLGQVGSVVGLQSLVANCAPQQRYSRVGGFSVVGSLGQFIGPIAAGLLQMDRSATSLELPGAAVFLAGGTATLVALSITASMLRCPRLERPHRHKSPVRESTAHAHLPRATLQVLRIGGVPPVMLASMTVLASSDVLIAYLPAYGQQVGLSGAAVGVLLSVRAGASLLARVFMVILSRRIGPRRLLMLSTATPAVTLALVPAFVDAPHLGSLLVVAGLGLGLGQPVSLAWIASAAPTAARGIALGIRLSGNRLAQVGMPVVAGALAATAGLGVVFWTLAASLALSTTLSARSSGLSG